MPPKNIRPPQKSPKKEELFAFCEEKGFSHVAQKIWDYYESNADDGYWYDGGGRLVRSWKGKLITVWFDYERNPAPRAEASGYGNNIPEF